MAAPDAHHQGGTPCPEMFQFEVTPLLLNGKHTHNPPSVILMVMQRKCLGMG